MNKDVVHVYNGILLSRKKEWNLGHLQRLSNTVKQVRKRKTNTIYKYMWNLKKMVQMILFTKQKQRDMENKHTDSKGERVDRVNWEIWTD